MPVQVLWLFLEKARSAWLRVTTSSKLLFEGPGERGELMQTYSERTDAAISTK
jgi:hypothetical protein